MLYHSSKNSKALIFNTNIAKLNETTKNRNKRPPENIYTNECFPKTKANHLIISRLAFTVILLIVF